MPSTYAPSIALQFAKTFVKFMPIDTQTAINYQILDYAHSIMWMAAPWRWSVGYVGTVILATGQSDYTLTDPTDFLYIEGAYITDGSSINELKPVAFLPVDTTTPGLPSEIAHVATNTYRITPVPTATGSQQKLIVYYKKARPAITAGNMNTAGVQVFDDEWFPVYQTGVLWLAYMYADDARAGAATVDQDGKTQYSGTLGAFQAGLAQMRRAENLIFQLPGNLGQQRSNG